MECPVCETEYEVEFDECCDAELRYCPFCGTDHKQHRELSELFDEEDLSELRQLDDDWGC